MVIVIKDRYFGERNKVSRDNSCFFKCSEVDVCIMGVGHRFSQILWRCTISQHRSHLISLAQVAQQRHN